MTVIKLDTRRLGDIDKKFEDKPLNLTVLNWRKVLKTPFWAFELKIWTKTFRHRKAWQNLQWTGDSMAVKAKQAYSTPPNVKKYPMSWGERFSSN